MKKYTFEKESSVFKALKERVDDYFTNNGSQTVGGQKLLGKAVIQLASGVILYVTLVFFTPVPVVSVLLCIVLGINLAVIGFNVMHEGGHRTFSRHGWINSLSAYSLNALGGISYYWKIKHNVNHHTYTNIDGLDSDIDVKPFMRLHRDQPRRWFHRFQYIYWVFLYAISYLAWIFYEDFEKYFRGRISPVSNKMQLPAREHFVFWTTKIMYVLLYMFIPILLVDFIPWLIGFIIITLVCGLTTSIVFQLAHVVERTQFHSATGDSHTRYEWAIHQIVSTSNFATHSKILHWLLGGLNFQIEHHLFPRISHIHYPVINQYVKQVCREYNVVYNEYTSMLRAIVSHVVYLRRLGQA